MYKRDQGMIRKSYNKTYSMPAETVTGQNHILVKYFVRISMY